MHIQRYLITILTALLFVACNKGTTSTESLAPTTDSTIVERILEFLEQKYPDFIGDTCIRATLTTNPCAYIEECSRGTYWVNNDTLTVRRTTSYVYHDNSKITLGGVKKDTMLLRSPNLYLQVKNPYYKYVNVKINPPNGIVEDTMLMKLSQTQYLISRDRFIEIARTDSTLRHFDWTAKCYFNEYDYNEKIHLLSERIIAGDSISDEDLLRIMPESEDQYHVFCSEGRCNSRSILIDSIALERAKINRLFIDAYIKQMPWSDGAGAELLFEGYYMQFFQYDSVYFNKAIHRILPEYINYFDEEWYEYARKNNH